MSARLANKKSQTRDAPVLLASAHSNKPETAQIQPILLAGARPRKIETAPNPKNKQHLTDLNSSETDYVLNSTFVLQSLMKKDFGLKIADIRSMQSHDRNLALEIAKIGTMNQEQTKT